MSFFPKISDERKAKIHRMFEQNNIFEPGSESNSLAIEWLKDHNNYFAGYLDGKWISGKEDEAGTKSSHKILDPFTGEHLYDVSIASEQILSLASKSSLEGQEKWTSLKDSQQKMQTLYRIAQSIEKNANLFALLESLSSGKHVHKTKTRDVPNLIESFYYYANLCDQCEDRKPLGVVCVIADEFNNPLMSISWRVGSILATGNSLLLLVDMKSCLSALFLAELCSLCGLPPGMLNVLPIDQENITCLPQASKFIFTGSFAKSRKIAQLALSMKIPYELSLSRRPVAIIYENADVHSAVQGVLDYLFFIDTRTESGGCKVLIQESVYEKVINLLRNFVQKIKLGINFSKTDMSGIITEGQKNSLNLFINDAKNQGAKIVQTSETYETGYPSWAPMLLSDITTASKFVHEEIGGPVIVTVSFRTAKESITMFNRNNLGADVSVWTDKLSLALEVAQELKSGTIWINTQNIFIPVAGYSSVYMKGYSVEGGQYALLMHLANVMDEDATITKSCEEDTKSTEECSELINEKCIELSNENAKNQLNSVTGIRSYDHFIGGSYKRSSTSTLICDKNNLPYAYIAGGSSAEIQAAVSSALAVLPKWKKTARHRCSQILVTLAENLCERKKEFASYLEAVLPRSYQTCLNEVEASIDCLFFWAFEVAKDFGKVKHTSDRMKVFEELESVGIIGIHCPSIDPLLSFLSRVAPAIAFGNAVVVIPNEKYPTLALKICEIFKYSDVPGGLINVITGTEETLIKDLVAHRDVNAMWFSSQNQAEKCMPYSFCPKRSFIYSSSWHNPDKSQRAWKLILESTHVKTVFLPAGDIFAN
ncbi:putative aldehyde dehydrogenase DhaS [Stegodyphus dumicola]|uniref:putative aldehyde dehydrogenase DhaS n=1 Tax=Stegodyphus dumicola TaxID=202533 RepID=UPI0015AB9095|nr:putative aldehyde dehydrogenase DhaS [Stegodyphus dumicola]